MLAAADLAADHRIGIWDAVILTAASASGCRLLLSEDLQDGLTWGGVTVANPFAGAPPFAGGTAGTGRAVLIAAVSPYAGGAALLLR
jgi:hypothetical protein